MLCVSVSCVAALSHLSQRFRPITVEKPKVLLPLVNVPLLEYTLEWLALNQVEEVREREGSDNREAHRERQAEYERGHQPSSTHIQQSHAHRGYTPHAAAAAATAAVVPVRAVHECPCVWNGNFQCVSVHNISVCSCVASVWGG